MPILIEPPPYTQVETVTDILHEAVVKDPYRWLEIQNSQQTRTWLASQHGCTRSYLDAILGRTRIRDSVRKLLDVETYDSVQQIGSKFIFRKRQPGEEQFRIYLRDGLNGEDQLLVDPAKRGAEKYTAVKPLRVSFDGRLLLYEVKEGGERTGIFEILDIPTRGKLPDTLPRGYLHGFAFSPNSQGFCYVHEPVHSNRAARLAVYDHVFGPSFDKDREVFVAGWSKNLRLTIVPGHEEMGFLVSTFGDEIYTDFYVWRYGSKDTPKPIVQNAKYKFAPVFLDCGRILAITDHDAPNSRIVEVRRTDGHEATFIDVVPASDRPIQSWTATESRVFVSYIRGTSSEVEVFDRSGRRLGKLPIEDWTTVRLIGSTERLDELFIEQESFSRPAQIWRYSNPANCLSLWAQRVLPLDTNSIGHTQVWFKAKDGTSIPMFLVGRHEVLDGSCHPTIMTSYGGHGISMTPQFSVFVSLLIQKGCLFALPNIRGGSEFGIQWHICVKRRNRQVAFEDFLCAAEWLVQTGKTQRNRLAIFGGSNAGLLVAAAMTQRPDLFRAVICLAPMLDVLRYHLFDYAHLWRSEFGTAEDADDFKALIEYSPYHNVHEGIAYPGTMIVSGDLDQNCNSLHARKMTARLQAANVSDRPIVLDYNPFRGHSPVLPLTDRIDALTDRIAFLCDQLELQF